MFAHLAADARSAVVRAAEQEAQALGSATVEAEHVLLALAADTAGPVGRLLAEVGCDHDGVLAALELETDRSLAAVGVALGDFGLAGVATTRRKKTRFAASAKRSLERAVQTAQARGDRTVTAAHLLVGILRGEIGTVARAVEAAGLDRVTLLLRAEALL